MSKNEQLEQRIRAMLVELAGLYQQANRVEQVFNRLQDTIIKYEGKLEMARELVGDERFAELVDEYNKSVDARTNDEPGQSTENPT